MTRGKIRLLYASLSLALSLVGCQQTVITQPSAGRPVVITSAGPGGQSPPKPFSGNAIEAIDPCATGFRTCAAP